MKNLHYRLLGLLSLGIGIIGAFLPLLPTTCFILLAGWCFAKSSPKWHQRLLDNPVFGSTLKQWETHRCIPTRAKKIATASIVISGGLSLWLLENPWLQAALIALLLIGLYSIHSIKQCQLHYPQK